MTITFGRRRVAIGLHRRRRAAHVLFDMGLAHAPVADRGLDDRGGLGDSQNAWIDTRGTGSIWAIGVVDCECARAFSSSC